MSREFGNRVGIKIEIKLQNAIKVDPIQKNAHISRSMVGERPRTATEKYAQILRDNLKGIKLITNEKDRWHILSKELSQKQE